jgi:hypothetical protein
MSDHTPANLARIIAPLLKVVPEAGPIGNEAPYLDAEGFWCLDKWSGIRIGEDHARLLILARLQLALDARACVVYKPGALAAYWDDGAVIEIDASDPIIARAQLLAKIVGVELGDADA